MIKICTNSQERICQGDIFRNVEFLERVTENEGVLEVSKIIFPYAIVLTQDCDLAQDCTFRNVVGKNQDKFLISVLLAPMYNAEHVFSGEHLSDIGMKSTPINKARTDGNMLKNNQKPRYHYLEFPRESTLVPLIIDFKHYFSAPVDYVRMLKKEAYICKVDQLYREDISQRFSAFLSRIGLPEGGI